MPTCSPFGEELFPLREGKHHHDTYFYYWCREVNTNHVEDKCLVRDMLQIEPLCHLQAELPLVS